MERERVDLIARVVATRNEVFYDRVLYCSLYYAFADVQNMTPIQVKEFYPWLYDPLIDSYKLDSETGALLTRKILGSIQVDLLNDIVDKLEQESQEQYYDDGVDEDEYTQYMYPRD